MMRKIIASTSRGTISGHVYKMNDGRMIVTSTPPGMINCAHSGKKTRKPSLEVAPVRDEH